MLGKTVDDFSRHWKFNGRSDLVDFFPVWLNIASALTHYPPASGIEYRLSQAGDALQFVYTGLTVANAGDYLITDVSGCGPAFDQNVYEVDTVKITASGVALSADFLGRIEADPDKGVILVEGIAASTAPLVLNVVSNGITLCEAQLPLSLSGVEDMFRHENLRPNPTVADRTNAPNEIATNGKNVVFVHGYNREGWILQKIYGDFLAFTYYLNPTPNDRNVEFDPEQNLFGGRERFAP